MREKTLYARLAWTGMRKNRRLYLPYLLSCAGMVLMFYILMGLSGSPVLEHMSGGTSSAIILRLGTVVIAVFALIFLFYTHSFLIRRREREFGLYNVLGMGKGNIARILLWETVITYGLTTGTGLLLGMVLYKLAELGMVRLLQVPVTYTLTVSVSSLLAAAALFAAIHTLILLNGLRQLHGVSAVGLLRSESVGEKPPKAQWVLTAAGAVLLAGCIGSFGFDMFTEKVLDIPAGSVGEALSVPMQQTARYIRDYGNEVTDDERTAIEKVLDYDAIAQSYMPELSDGVKQYYKNPGKGDLARYMLVWAKMLLKHPVCYFEATHANSHGYYTITKCRAINDYYTFNNDICMEMSEMNVHYLDKSGYLRYAFVQALSAFEKLPLVGLTTSIGFMAWLTAVLGLWLARCKAKPVLPVFIGLGIFWLTCIASPVNDCMRYFLPVAGCLPLVFCLAAVFSREKSEITV